MRRAGWIPVCIYAIEDVYPDGMMKFAAHFKKTDYQVEFVELHRRGVVLTANALIVVRK